MCSQPISRRSEPLPVVRELVPRKTFKGLTDELLTWQTERFLELETHRKRHIVYVRREQVVEVAFDGVQRSSRYPVGVALRFARVIRYRDDRVPSEADTIDAVRSYLGDQVGRRERTRRVD